jgi:glucokinase
MSEPVVILADIGGTNTRVALADGRQVRTESIAKFPNAEFPSLEPVLRRYLDEAGLASVDGVCVAAAGPVKDGVAEMTNISWVIDHAQLTRATGARRVAILNDLQAQGQALGQIAASNLRPVLAGDAAHKGTMLVVGLGTGVNAAPVHDTPWGRIVPPSECGHISMPVDTPEAAQLARFIEAYGPHAHGFASVEDVLAGRGVEHLYAFVTAEMTGQPVARSSAEVMAALERGEAPARATARLYTQILGSALGNLALIHLPFGGIYLIGGMARAFTPYLLEMGFAEAFCAKGRFAAFLKNFSVTTVEDDFAALTGCANYLANGGKG